MSNVALTWIENLAEQADDPEAYSQTVQRLTEEARVINMEKKKTRQNLLGLRILLSTQRLS